MELKKEEYEFLVLQHRNHDFNLRKARRQVGKNCEQMEDIVLDYNFMH